MNDKMKEYLTKQCELQENAETDLMMTLGNELPYTTYNILMRLLGQNRYIRHAVLESADCDHCKENGLV
jgi:hypothetical protein